MTDRRIALLLLLSLLLLALGIGVLLAWHRASFQAMPAAQVASPLTSPGGAQCHSLDGLPDPVCTPGAADPRVTQDNLQTTICVSGYTTRVRPSTSYTNALKRTQITEYGYTDTNLADYEEDHLIPLELGGHPSDPRNLWPEPWAVLIRPPRRIAWRTRSMQRSAPDCRRWLRRRRRLLGTGSPSPFEAFEIMPPPA
jgi:hypothetical protein